nr:unnamed protein product [Spirometra erinaceieuropaei]
MDPLSLVAEHCANSGHTFAFQNAEILGRGNDRITRETIEAWHTGANSINRSVALPEAYQALQTQLSEQKSRVRLRQDRNPSTAESMGATRAAVLQPESDEGAIVTTAASSTYVAGVRTNDRSNANGPDEGAIITATHAADTERPTDVKAEAISSESIQVTWKAPSYKLSNESGYRLHIIGQDFNDTAVVGRDTLTHTFFGLKPSTEYAVYVQVNDSVRGVPRPTGNSSAKTWPEEIERPTDVKAEAISSESIQVTWKAPSYKLSNESGYRLHIIGQDFNDTAVVGRDTLTHTFFGLKPSTEYAVYVQVNDSVRGVPRPTGNSSAKTWPEARQACGKRTLAPAVWSVLQSTRHEANQHSWPWTTPCFGDSGAGVYCPNDQGKWFLYGIINRGNFLCVGQYATSTKILPHAGWIKEVIAANVVQ